VQQITLLHTVAAAMIDHAYREAPQEAVGLLGSDTHSRVVCHVPCTNLGAINSYLVDPYSQYQAIKYIRGRDLHPLAMYHSHPGGSTYLSDCDKKYAARTSLVQIVVAFSSATPGTAVLAAYRVITASHIEPINILIERA
jgi:proteasome lid subunit RPN8/RPN11